MKKRIVKANANRRKAISRKGMDQALWWVLDVILVLLSLMLFAAIIGSFGPDKQVAILNTELLRSKMNEACLNGQATMSKFSLQQPKPNNMLGAFDVLPRFSINTGGDPQYVLYYESFPPGEAVGWEFYHNFPDRFVVAFNARNYPEMQGKLETIGSSITGSDVDTFIRLMKNYEESIRIEGSSYSEKNTLVSNVILNPYMNVIPTEDAKPAVELMKGVNDTGNLGAPSETNRDFFEFSSYVSLSKQEQTYIKYRSCGPYSLCLKTREGVYSFPLEQCRSAGIQYVQLVYDARGHDFNDLFVGGALQGVGRIAILGLKKVLGLVPFLGWIMNGATGVELTKFVLKLATTYKVSDFYSVSPCSLDNIRIERFDNCGRGGGDNSCDKIVSYPVYEYSATGNDKTVKYTGNHYSCMASINDEANIITGLQNIPCLRITTNSPKNDFCFTKNPDVKNSYDTGAGYQSGVFGFNWDEFKRQFTSADVFTRFVGGIGGTPVKDTTRYLPNTKSVLLKSSKVGEGWFETFKSVMGNTFELTWAWPS